MLFIFHRKSLSPDQIVRVVGVVDSAPNSGVQLPLDGGRDRREARQGTSQGGLVTNLHLLTT